MENWTKEYAPKTLEEYVQDDEIKETIQKYIDNDMRTPMIFEGPAGTGKTTLARIIGNEMNANVYELNASTDNGVDVVREKIVTWARSKPFSDKRTDGLNLIFCDESERFTPQAQDALKRTIDDYGKHTIFIFCTNNIHKIIKPIQSRAGKYCLHIGYVDRISIENLIFQTAEKAQITIEYDDLIKIADKADGEPRAAINMLQSYAIGDFNESGSKRDDFRSFMAMALHDEHPLDAITRVSENDLQEFGRYIISTEKQPMGLRKELLKIVADTDKAIQNSVNKDIHLIDMYIKIVEALK